MISELYFDDLVGRGARVKECSNPGSLGLRGVLKDETLNTVTLATEHGDKMIPKKGTKLMVLYDDQETEIICDAIIFRPEERIKNRGRIEKNLKRSK